MIQVMDVGQTRDIRRFKLALIATAAFVGIVDVKKDNTIQIARQLRII
jgi:hypothetical protein